MARPSGLRAAFCSVPPIENAARWAVRTRVTYRTFVRREDAVTWAKMYRLHTGRRAVVERTEV